MRAIIGLLTLTLTACATSSVSTHHWIGQNAETLVSRLGTPEQLIQTPGGTSYYVYSNQTTQRFPSQTYQTVNVLVVGKTTIGTVVPEPTPKRYSPTCITTYVVNKQKVITSISQVGPLCRK